MNKMLKVAGIVAITMTAGVVGYTMMNKNIRRKMCDLADAMADETKSMLNNK